MSWPITIAVVGIISFIAYIYVLTHFIVKFW